MIYSLIVPQLAFTFVASSIFTKRSGYYSHSELMKKADDSSVAYDLTQRPDKPTHVLDTTGHHAKRPLFHILPGKCPAKMLHLVIDVKVGTKQKYLLIYPFRGLWCSLLEHCSSSRFLKILQSFQKTLPNLWMDPLRHELMPNQRGNANTKK